MLAEACDRAAPIVVYSAGDIGKRHETAADGLRPPARVS